MKKSDIAFSYLFNRILIKERTMRKFIFFSLTIMLCGLMLGNQAWAFSTSSATITLEKSVHFTTPDGSDVVVEPGTYTIEAAEEWLRLISGERRDALLLEAIKTQHDENLKVANALSQSSAADEHRITLLLPGGKGLEAIGSVSGVRSRAVRRPPTSRTRTQQQQVSRISTQSKNNTASKKSNPMPKSPVQPNNLLTQRVQALEHQVSTLQATINSLQSRLTKIESAVQVSNSGKVTINGTTLKLSAAMVDVQAGTSKFSGLVQADTLGTNSVISKSYTPGAGNIW
jgi:hypothetical protein